MNEKVVKVYSEAFFELSKEKNKLDQNRQDLKEIEEEAIKRLDVRPVSKFEEVAEIAIGDFNEDK